MKDGWRSYDQIVEQRAKRQATVASWNTLALGILSVGLMALALVTGMTTLLALIFLSATGALIISLPVINHSSVSKKTRRKAGLGAALALASLILSFFLSPMVTHHPRNRNREHMKPSRARITVRPSPRSGLRAFLSH